MHLLNGLLQLLHQTRSRLQYDERFLLLRDLPFPSEDRANPGKHVRASDEKQCRGGLVRDEALHNKATEKIREFLEAAGHQVIGVVPSTITGTEGNQEFFLCARKR